MTTKVIIKVEAHQLDRFVRIETMAGEEVVLTKDVEGGDSTTETYIYEGQSIRITELMKENANG